MNLKLHVHFLLPLLILVGSFYSSPHFEAIAKADPDPGMALAPVTIYLVRHAEKEIASPTDQDPGLSPQGFARAASLQALLKEVPVHAVYVTKYKRSYQTLKPIADARKLPLQTYEANDFNGLKQRLLKKHIGQTVVVAGHSNTLLPLLQELGAKTKIVNITESTYDYIFKVVVNPDKTATVEINRYGASYE